MVHGRQGTLPVPRHVLHWSCNKASSLPVPVHRGHGPVGGSTCFCSSSRTLLRRRIFIAGPSSVAASIRVRLPRGSFCSARSRRVPTLDQAVCEDLTKS